MEARTLVIVIFLAIPFPGAAELVRAFNCTVVKCPRDYFCADRRSCVECSSICPDGGHCADLCPDFTTVKVEPEKVNAHKPNISTDVTSLPDTDPTERSTTTAPTPARTKTSGILLTHGHITFLGVIVLILILMLFGLLATALAYCICTRKKSQTSTDRNVPDIEMEPLNVEEGRQRTPEETANDNLPAPSNGVPRVEDETVKPTNPSLGTDSLRFQFGFSSSYDNDAVPSRPPGHAEQVSGAIQDTESVPPNIHPQQPPPPPPQPPINNGVPTGPLSGASATGGLLSNGSVESDSARILRTAAAAPEALDRSDGTPAESTSRVEGSNVTSLNATSQDVTSYDVTSDEEASIDEASHNVTSDGETSSFLASRTEETANEEDEAPADIVEEDTPFLGQGATEGAPIRGDTSRDRADDSSSQDKYEKG